MVPRCSDLQGGRKGTFLENKPAHISWAAECRSHTVSCFYCWGPLSAFSRQPHNLLAFLSSTAFRLKSARFKNPVVVIESLILHKLKIAPCIFSLVAVAKCNLTAAIVQRSVEKGAGKLSPRVLPPWRLLATLDFNGINEYKPGSHKDQEVWTRI